MFAQQSGCVAASIPPSFPPLSPFISGSIRNTARSEGKHKQTGPSLTAPSPHPSRRVYVGRSDSISPLHRLHRATLHFTNTEKTHIGSVHFEPPHGPFISLLSVTERHQRHSIPSSLFRDTRIIEIWGQLKNCPSSFPQSVHLTETVYETSGHAHMLNIF